MAACIPVAAHQPRASIMSRFATTLVAATALLACCPTSTAASTGDRNLASQEVQVRVAEAISALLSDGGTVSLGEFEKDFSTRMPEFEVTADATVFSARAANTPTLSLSYTQWKSGGSFFSAGWMKPTAPLGRFGPWAAPPDGVCLQAALIEADTTNRGWQQVVAPQFDHGPPSPIPPSSRHGSRSNGGT